MPKLALKPEEKKMPVLAEAPANPWSDIFGQVMAKKVKAAEPVEEKWQKGWGDAAKSVSDNRRELRKERKATKARERANTNQ